MQKVKTVFIACLLSLAVCSQAREKADSSLVKAVAKLNLLALPLKTVSVQGEVSFARHWSTCLGVSYMPKRELPFGAGNKIEPYFTGTRFRAFLLTPEVRWYPVKKQQAPNGFYLAGYLRYKQTRLTTSFAFTDSATQYVFPITYSSNAIAIGGMLGYQFILNHFSLDLWVIGAHLGYQKSSVDVDITSLSALFEEPLVKKQMDKVFYSTAVPGWLKREAEHYLEQQEISFGWSQPYPGIRTGITIGYRF